MTMRPLACVLAVSCFWACQSYDFVFQPDSQREGVHLRFTVQQPSKADLLFVIDNSSSMRSEQEALKASIETLLEELAVQDTSYRIGIVSTDAHGFRTDCSEAEFEPLADDPYYFAHAGRGDCARPEVQLHRPHDGARGRLIAAYDPVAFDPNNNTLTPGQRTRLATLLPTSANDPNNPLRFVIDRDDIRAQACEACGVEVCAEGVDLYEACARDLANEMVKAFFRANIAGLGIDGFGHEEGMKAALLAVGIDPEEPTDTSALNPLYDVTAEGGPNRYTSLDRDGVAFESSWVRSDALLAMMFVTDEEDCSARYNFLSRLNTFEEGSTPPYPAGSMCYRKDLRGGSGFLQPTDMARLLVKKKGNVNSRVAVGMIGGVERGVDSPADDCIAEAVAQPQTACACLEGAVVLPSLEPDDRWCELLHEMPSPGSLQRCDALAGTRYVDFAKRFTRRSFESICRNDAERFGEAMRDFAKIATLACFDLNDTRPAPVGPNARLADNIVVHYLPKDGEGRPTLLPNQSDPTSSEQGWYYDEVNNRICLTALARSVDDEYDIFILNADKVELVPQ